MPTRKQILGDRGELLVITHCSCPKCKRTHTLKKLRQNFKCADIICDFCGYVAQVKASTAAAVDVLPKTILGAAWGVQKERLDAGIYMPLFLVQVDSSGNFAVYYLAADLQTPDLFKPRKPLSATARRHGWQGFIYDLTKLRQGGMVRLL